MLRLDPQDEKALIDAIRHGERACKPFSLLSPCDDGMSFGPKANASACSIAAVRSETALTSKKASKALEMRRRWHRLGYPGMGARFINYLIAHPRIIPEASKPLSTEKIVYLPVTYQANDQAEVAAVPPSRRQPGLPAEGFVFCCFNNSYKIRPHVFSVWMGFSSRRRQRPVASWR